MTSRVWGLRTILEQTALSLFATVTLVLAVGVSAPSTAAIECNEDNTFCALASANANAVQFEGGGYHWSAFPTTQGTLTREASNNQAVVDGCDVEIVGESSPFDEGFECTTSTLTSNHAMGECLDVEAKTFLPGVDEAVDTASDCWN